MKAAAYLGDRSHCYVSVEGLEKPLAIATQETEIHRYLFPRQSGMALLGDRVADFAAWLGSGLILNDG